MRLSSMALQSNGLGWSNIHNHFGAGSDLPRGTDKEGFGKGPYFFETWSRQNPAY
jgi:hypothetical protein